MAKSKYDKTMHKLEKANNAAGLGNSILPLNTSQALYVAQQLRRNHIIYRDNDQLKVMFRSKNSGRYKREMIKVRDDGMISCAGKTYKNWVSLEKNLIRKPGKVKKVSPEQLNWVVGLAKRYRGKGAASASEQAPKRRAQSTPAARTNAPPPKLRGFTSPQPHQSNQNNIFLYSQQELYYPSTNNSWFQQQNQQAFPQSFNHASNQGAAGNSYPDAANPSGFTQRPPAHTGHYVSAPHYPSQQVSSQQTPSGMYSYENRSQYPSQQKSSYQASTGGRTYGAVAQSASTHYRTPQKNPKGRYDNNPVTQGQGLAAYTAGSSYQQTDLAATKNYSTGSYQSDQKSQYGLWKFTQKKGSPSMAAKYRARYERLQKGAEGNSAKAAVENIQRSKKPSY